MVAISTTGTLPEPGDEFELKIDSLAASGMGVGRHAGLVVFVPLCAPGDTLRVRVTRARRRWARAEILEIIEPGPGRRDAPCPYYARCGGCDWMHIDVDEQSRARVAIVCEALHRIGGIDTLPPVELVPSALAFGYRARARVGYAPGRVGFRARGSRELVDVERCAVLDAGTQEALTKLRGNPPAGRGELEIRSYGDTLRVGPRIYQISPRDFFQANGALWERWFEVVVQACGTGAFAVELYAGVGFYTAGLAERFARVIAIERGRAALQAQRNLSALQAQRRTQVSVIRAAAEDWAPRELAQLAPELVLLNPPREGCHRSVLDAVCESGAARVVYVSCDPSTLARDLGRCVGELRLERLVVMDSLPQTHHVEVVSVLERVDSSRAGKLD